MSSISLLVSVLPAQGRSDAGVRSTAIGEEKDTAAMMAVNTAAIPILRRHDTR